MSAYTEFFLNTKPNVIQYELLEISHPNFTQTYYIVRNAANGLTVTHEAGGGGVKNYQYYPLKITGLGARDDLDQKIKVELGDLGEIIPKELDAVHVANGLLVKPTVKYRVYRSDDLALPMFGPITLQITDLKSNAQGAYFEASAPRLNDASTGELYRMDRFEMLRGFV